MPMTPLIPVTDIRRHIRSTRNDEDDYLLLLLSAAVSHFGDYTGRVLLPQDTAPENLNSEDIPMQPSIQQGLLLLIGHWYENREMTTDRPLSVAPAATYDLWSPFVWFHLGDSS